jgi:hypothetical protein
MERGRSIVLRRLVGIACVSSSFFLSQFIWGFGDGKGREVALLMPV